MAFSSDTPILDFFVDGTARTAGSKRHVGRGRIIEDCGTSYGWRQSVAARATVAMHEADLVLIPHGTPIALQLDIVRVRPKAHTGARGLLPSAPAYPTTRPDLLKHARAVEDAMSGIVYEDDSDIVRETLGKDYGSPPGVRVRLWIMPASE